MINFDEIQKNIDQAFEEFLSQMLRLDDDKLKYYYWTVDFFETVGNVSFRYFSLTAEQKEIINTEGKNLFEDKDIYFEVNKNSHRHDLNIKNIAKLFSDYKKSGQQAIYEYLKEFIFWQILKEIEEIPVATTESQKNNFLFTYVKYLIENTDKPTFTALKQYKKYTLTNQGEVLDKKIKDFSSKGVNNDQLLYKIDKLFILREDEAKLHFVFSIAGGEEKEELRELLDVMGREEAGRLYRGQASSTWKLNSSLTREPKYLANESDMYYDILSLKPDAFVNDHTIYERLITMQHFEMPTRLLDITRNPLVAIFFACNNLPEAKKDGVIFTFAPAKEKILNFEDEKLKCFKNLYVKNNSNSDINEDEAEKFLSEICFIKGVAKNQRINSQSGDFIFVGKGKDVSTELRKLTALTIIIDAPTKKVLLEQLESLNIHGGAVYPDLTHMSNYIKNKYLGKKKVSSTELLNDFDLSAFNNKQKKKTEKNINFSEWVQEELKNPSDLTIEENRTLLELISGRKVDNKRIPIDLVNTFNSEIFWDLNRKSMFSTFCKVYNLKENETQKIIENLIAFDKNPLPDELIDAMNNKPNLRDRREKAEELSDRILSFANELKENKDFV